MKFELKKIFKQIPIVWIFIILVFSCIGLFYKNTYQFNKEKEEKISLLKNSVKSYEKEISHIDKESEKINFKKTLNELKLEIKVLTHEGNEYLDWIIERTDIINHPEITPLFDIEGTSIPNEINTFSNIMYKKIREENIPPIYPLTRLSNFYQLGNLTNEQLKDWKTTNNSFPARSFYFVWSQIQKDRLIILTIILLVLLFSSYSQSLKKINLYKAEKINITRIFFNNLAAKFIFYFGFFIIFILTLLISLGLSKGFGSLNYPVLVNTYSMRTLTFITLKQYFIQTLVLFILNGLLIISLTQLIETIIINPIIATFSEIVMLVLGTFILPFHQFNPFSYFKIDRVITADFGTPYETNNWGLYQGCLLLITFSLILILISYFIILFKNIRESPLNNKKIH